MKQSQTNPEPLVTLQMEARVSEQAEDPLMCRLSGCRDAGLRSDRKVNVKRRFGVVAGVAMLRGYWDSLCRSGTRTPGLEIRKCVPTRPLFQDFLPRRFPTSPHGWNRGPRRRLSGFSRAPCTRPSLWNCPWSSSGTNQIERCLQQLMWSALQHRGHDGCSTLDPALCWLARLY